MMKRVLVTVIPALACLAFAAPALGRVSATGQATTQVAASQNWAGYVAGQNSGSGFTAASTAWTQPKVSCSATGVPTYSAYWVGLGGGGEQSQALEQIGTQADCGSNGTASYYAWYELVPSAPVRLKLAVHPVDRIWARTAVNGDSVSFYITNQTTHRTWSRTLRMTAATPDTSTAEWVAEAPSACAGGAMGDCTPLPLADFGKASFSDAHATAGGHTGSIEDSHWTAQAIALEPSSSSVFGAGYGGYLNGGHRGYSADTSYSSGEGAAPGSLSSSGTAFSVRYGASLQDSGAGYGNGSGYGYPGAGYGYPGGGYGYPGAGYGYPGGGYSYGGGYGVYGYLGGTGGYYGGWDH